MAGTLLHGKSQGQSGFVRSVVLHDFGVVLRSQREVCGELPLISCQEAELRIRDNRVSTAAVILRIVIARLQAEQCGSDIPLGADPVDRQARIGALQLRGAWELVRAKRRL